MEKQIAQTILNQINSLDKWAMPSYAAENLTVLPEQTTHQGGLYFKCNGYKVKGSVHILLHWNDTYTIKFFDNNRNLMKELDGVYCDQLVEVLDYIEEREVEFSLN